MNVEVFGSAIADLETRMTPLREATQGAEQVVDATFQGPSSDPAMTWESVYEWLDGYPENEHTGLELYWRTVLANWPSEDAEQLWAWWKTLRDSYDVLCGLLRGCEVLVAFYADEDEATEWLLAWKLELTWAWSEWWVALGWIGRWIHHQTRRQPPMITP